MSESAIAITEGSSGSPRLPLELDRPTGVPSPETVTPRSAWKSLTWIELLKRAFSFPAMLGAVFVGRVFYEGRNFFVDPDVW